MPNAIAEPPEPRYPGLPLDRHANDDEPLDEHRAEIRQLGRWTYEVQLITTHHITLPGVPKPQTVDMCLQSPPVVLGRRWAKSKARRMVAAAYRDDERKANRTVIR